LGDTQQMLVGSQIYVPYAPTARLLKAMFLRVTKAGWKGWGCGELLVASKGPLPLEVMVRDVTGESEPTFAMSLGFGGNFRKLAVQVMRPNGEILGYIKLPLTEAATERVRHEAAILERLWNFAPLHPHIPKVLYASEWADGFLLFQSTGPRRPGPVKFGRLHEVFLRTLWGVYRAEKPGRTLVEEVAARWQKAVSLMDAELPQLGKRALERASRELGGLMIPCGILHGDFAPWNTRVEPERLFVFDWESAASDAPILWDMFHFRVQVASLLNKNSGWGFPSSQTRIDSGSFLLYLLSSVCQYLEEGGTRHPGIEYRKHILLRELS
jgi:thiamine kinase-like enzyme